MNEKRKFHRISHHCLNKIEAKAANEVTGFISNISLRGVFIEGMEGLTPGNFYKLQLIISATGRVLEVEAICVWNSTNPLGTGFHFAKSEEYNLKIILNFLEQHLKSSEYRLEAKNFWDLHPPLYGEDQVY
jgi:hypothetical protein